MNFNRKETMKKSTDRIMAEELCTLLDDISTLSDIIKPTREEGYKMFYKRALQLAEKRSKYMVSLDGQTLLTTKEARKFEEKALHEPYEFPQTSEVFSG